MKQLLKFQSLRTIGLASLLAVALQGGSPIARALTLAEFTGGEQFIVGVPGQSFTTGPGSAATNIVFNFFSDVPATDPIALGIGFLLSQEYSGPPFPLDSSTPGYLGEATGNGDFYSFGPAVELQANTQYFLYSNAAFAVSASFTDLYAGGQGYAFSPIDDFRPFGDRNFRVTGTALNGVPENGFSVLLLGLSLLAVVALYHHSAIACSQRSKAT